MTADAKGPPASVSAGRRWTDPLPPVLAEQVLGTAVVSVVLGDSDYGNSQR